MTPWISVLIPAYEHPEGVRRILDAIYFSSEHGIECIIGDDSNSNIVELMVKFHPLYINGHVCYHRNKYSCGAVKNWNNLINRAKGEYLLLMHHDECPENYIFFSQLNNIINIHNKPDIIFLRCSLPILMNRRLRYHMPFSLKFIFLKFAPGYLILHNVIGSPSNVVIRQDVCLDFDDRLKWMVDVDWMVRLLRQSKNNWIIAKCLSIVSIYNKSTSITSSLGSNVSKLRYKESRYIQNKLGHMPVFNYIFQNTLAEKFVSSIERLCWFFVHIVIRIMGYFNSRPTPNWLKKKNGNI